KARRGRERLLGLDAVLREDEVRLAVEVRVDGSEERELRLLEREPAALGIVRAALELLDLRVVRGRPAADREDVERRLEESERRARHRPGEPGGRSRAARGDLELADGRVGGPVRRLRDRRS